MSFNPEVHPRRSIRLKGYDYSMAGAYFVTICCWQRECLFGDVEDGDVRLNHCGEIITSLWEKVPDYFPGITADAFVVMPNHFHGIVTIGDVGAGSPRPIQRTAEQAKGGETPPLRNPSVGQIVGYFKYQSTKHINVLRDNPGVPVWQRNYHERIIRSDDELNAARKYIEENPLKWDMDKENPANLPMP